MAEKKRIGRPSGFTQAKADEICERIAAGESLVSICKDDAMPCYTTAQKWLGTHESFAAKYARAREDQADVLADEMLDIARSPSADQVAAADKRLLIDALKWRAAKLRPRVYADRSTVEQQHSGEVAHTIRVVLTDD